MKKLLQVLVIVMMFLASASTASIFAEEHGALHERVISLHEAEVSEPMTYDEMVAQYALDADVSIEEAEAIFFMATGGIEGRINRLDAQQYRTLSDPLNVTSEYKPKINFYCKVTEGGGFAAIQEVLNVNMNRVYNGMSKQFAGTVYYNLEDTTHIYYTIDGDFYDNGSTTVGFSASIGIGEAASVTFSCSNTSSHYAGFYVATRLKWGNS